ncbi:hypothetical protein O181_072608 [Austropuccinia psidii MF-1]|uniref:Metallo-beta-lactamase domain-containing protein n=1 Tax=Austropuccinia psidii MF-1 TaxID=1389203 RepID=A0A9Q3F3B0_9BASI|nr:hypothetical protein [Austropuccinia psidii MF-1]
MNSQKVRLELLLLGTGTSSQVPSITCLTDPSGNGCDCCKSTDKKNQRRNTSALLRINHLIAHNLTTNHILIDVGKSFYEASKDLFPKNRIRKLDAVILTHPHADAINGLDDLRAWTLGRAIQNSIPIYCNQYTYSEISKSFRYLVNSDAKTGGGDVPEFEWRIIENSLAFEICGIQITPLPVHHGKFFGTATPTPYICLSYLFNQSICYMADVSEIPHSTWTLIRKILNPSTPLPILIVDTLRIGPHNSHFGIAQAVETAHTFPALKTYLLGFSHRVTHDCWVHCCKAISQGKVSDLVPRPASSPLAPQGIKEDFEWFTQTALREIEQFSHSFRQKSIWLRPAFDGLWVKTDGHSAWDDAYED